MPASSPCPWERRPTRAPGWCCGPGSGCSARRGSGRAGRNPWSIAWNSHPGRRRGRGSGCCWCSPGRCTGASWLSRRGSWCRSPPWSSRWWRCGWGSSRWWRPPPPPAPCAWCDACCGLSPWSLRADGRFSGAGSSGRNIWWWPSQGRRRRRWRRRSLSPCPSTSRDQGTSAYTWFYLEWEQVDFERVGHYEGSAKITLLFEVYWQCVHCVYRLFSVIICFSDPVARKTHRHWQLFHRLQESKGKIHFQIVNSKKVLVLLWLGY